MIDRWWSRPESSLAALGRVDSSDTKQGVGTAVLAYHGLSKAILEPIGLSTLQDVPAVCKALHGLDIAPVAAALGHATEPEMGGASTRYGQLLADDLHRVAIESTGRMITGLVQSGMPWPTAIDRASRVHGIPADRLGRAGVALRAPVMAPLAVDDIADRALMEYASHVGRREATAQDVSKAERERFREEEVVRDDQGRFAGEAPRNALVALSRDGLDDAMERQRKREKKDKRARVMARKKSLAASREARRPKEVTLADIARAQQQRKDQATAGTATEPARELRTDGTGDAARGRAEAKAARLDAAKDARKDTRLAAAKAKRREASKNRLLEALRNRKPPGPGEEFGDLLDNPVKPRGDGMHAGHVSGSKGQQQFMLLDVRLAEAAVKQGGFNYGTISSSPHFYGGFDSRSGDEAMDRETLRDVIISRSYEPDVGEGRTFLDGLAIVVFDGDVAHPAGFTGIYDEPLANAGTYRVRALRDGSQRLADALSYDDAYGLNLRAYENPGSRTSPKVDISLPHFVVHLDNGKAFTDDAEEVEKAWDEASVERDEDGKFADETRTMRTPEEKAAKRAKLLKRRRRMADIKVRAAARKTPEVTLADIARAQQARRTTARADAAQSSVGGDVGIGAPDRELRMDAAREARVAAARDLRKERRSQDAKARRGVQSRERLAARLAAMNEVREEHHDEWKNLDALTFDSDMAHGTFVDMFGFDPYNGREIQAGRAVHGDVEHEYMLKDQMARVKPAAKVTEALHVRTPALATGEEKSAWADGETIESHQHWFDAFASAQEECDRQNAVLTSSRMAWKPFVQQDRQTGMFHPWMAEAFKTEEQIVVLGSRDDWNLVRNGSDVKLVPLAGFDADPNNPGQGSFDMLFNAVSDAGEFGSYSGTSTRSDYFIRAFRIKT